jgi:hypothetical protein
MRADCGTVEAVANSNQDGFIDFDDRREGYTQSRSKFIPVVAIPKASKKQAGQGFLGFRAEERVGSLLAAAGTVWLVYVATTDFNNMWQMRIMPPGPIEICALGILLWLHAKWRRSIKT